MKKTMTGKKVMLAWSVLTVLMAEAWAQTPAVSSSTVKLNAPTQTVSGDQKANQMGLIKNTTVPGTVMNRPNLLTNPSAASSTAVNPSPASTAVNNQNSLMGGNQGVGPAMGSGQGVDNNLYATQRNTLRLISEKKAELALLNVQKEIDQAKKSAFEASQKDFSGKEDLNLKSELEKIKKENTKGGASTLTPSADTSMPVVLLATFTSPEHPELSYAEIKVGEQLVHAKVGDRLPSGHILKSVNFDSIEFAKKKDKKNTTVYISALESVNLGGASRGAWDTGSSANAMPAVVPQQAPMSLPPMQSQPR